MSAPRFSYTIEPLSSNHNCDDFCCGMEALDRYLKKQARQDLDRFLTAIFVLQDLEQKRIAGYYSLAATAIELGDLPEYITRKIPKYPLATIIKILG